jgi:hypothetical protein
MGLGGRGATAENTLLVDDMSYKNVLNDPYNAVHPVTFTYFTEKSTKKGPLPYLSDVALSKGFEGIRVAHPSILQTTQPLRVQAVISERQGV